MMNFFKTLFYLTGIDQVNTNESFSEETLWVFSLINFAYIFCIMLFQYWRQDLFYYPDAKPLTAAIDFFLYNLQIFAHLIILLEAHFKRRTHKRLKETLKKIYQDLSSLPLKKPSATKNLFWSFIALNGVCTTMIFFIVYLAVDFQLRNSNMLAAYSCLVKQLNDFFLIFYVQQLKQIMKLMEKEINCNNMKVVGSILLDIYKANMYLKKVFGASILASVIANFLEFVFGAYWNVFILRSDNENFNTLEMFLCTFFPLINLCVLFFVCTDYVKQVNLM